MSESLINRIKSEKLNTNLNQNDLNSLPSNELKEEINNSISKLDKIFSIYLNNEKYKDNKEINALHISYKEIKDKFNYYLLSNSRNIDMIKKGLEIITIRLNKIIQKEEQKSNQSVLKEENERNIEEPKLEETIIKEEIPKPFINNTEVLSENSVDKSIRKKEITNKISLCNIEIKEIKDNIQKFDDELNRKQKYLDTNKFYLDPIDVYGFEKAIQNNKTKIDNQKILLEKAQEKMKEYIGELSELNDINMAKTAVYDNLKEQIRLEKERELIDQKLNSLREEVPETLFTDDELENNSKITLK